MEKQYTEKLSDKAFARLMTTSVLGILACIICLCSTTYAWFSGSVQADSNTLKAADACLISVSVYKDGTEEAIIDTENPVTLECEGIYTVTLTLPKESASGYLILTVDGRDYYSDYLQRNDDADGALTFTLNVKAAKSATFTARWGIYSGECHVKNGETLTVG
ncbi:MAG: hypothetical protein IJW66_04460 [Clostridia bacterium]|nr:hypothetical protein [Clostridia bacterium]